jgi:two-component system sensor kinase FixL
MKSEAEQVEQVFSTAEVWPKEKPEVKNRLPGNHRLVIIVSVFFLLALAVSISVYMSAVGELTALATASGKAAPSIPALVASANHWALQLAIAAVASSIALFAVAIIGARSVRSTWVKRHTTALAEADARSQRLLGQLADSRVTEEESRVAQQEMQTRLTKSQHRQAALEQELERQRQAEKNMAQQTSKLERSKDILEMHVQARTQELQKLQRRNELILNSAGEGICGFDLQGRATFVNPAAARITGWKVEELIGKGEEQIFFPAKAAGVEGPGLVTDAEGNLLAEQLFYRKDGSCFSAEYMRTPIHEGDKTVGAVVMFKDITERRLAEDKLNLKAAELGRSNRELEQFAFVASHDLQEPLRKIQAFGDRLKVKCESVQLEEGRDYLERMQSAAARMQTLINDLLTFSRVLSSQQPFVEVDLAKVTGEVLTDLEFRIEKTGAKVSVGPLPTIEADPTQMRQLLQNLIGNALKFQPANATPQVAVEAKIRNREEIPDLPLPKSLVAPSADDQFCVLTVKDNGIGFDEQYLEKVFAVFQRLHGRSEYEGTGVGLAVCRRITDRHGGVITARSRLGEGSTFIVVLPIKRSTPEVGQ